jgi:uncharacterized protein YjiS (DUF1127 family)
MPLTLDQFRHPTDDPRRDAVERAVKAATIARLAREIGIDEALAAVIAAGGGAKSETATPREAAAAARRSQREQMEAKLNRLEQQGRGRDAVKVVARDFARDRKDPIEVASLARTLRRWRNERDNVHPQPSRSDTD